MKNRAVYDSLLEGVQILDKELRYLYVNHSAATHGKSTPEELIGRKMVEAYPGIEETDIFQKILWVIENQLPKSLDNKFTHNDGSIGWFNLNILPHDQGGVLIFSIDITEKKVLLEENFRKTKMEALQNLAAGVAHDFNNKLSIFELSFNSIKRNHEVDETILKGIEDNIESSKELVNTLLGFSDPSINEDSEVDVHAFVRELPHRYQEFLGDKITLSAQAGENCSNAPITSVQLDQILLNLIVNAKHAMKDGTDGKIEIISKNEEIVGLKGEHPSLLVPGNYIHLSITDNGCGIPKDVQEHIFDYYYTTKPEGVGTGLGLATIRTIVANSGGKILLSSEVGKGTTFDIWLKAI